MPRLCAVVLFALLLSTTVAGASVTISILDVGQGDATLVESSSGMTLLFDGGPTDAGVEVILPYLTSRGITSLDYLVASHYHADHIGGLDEVYNRTGATHGVWDRGWTYTTATYNSYANAVADDRHTIDDTMVFDLGDGVTVTCLTVNGNGQLSSPFTSSTKENEYCVTLLVECGDFDYFQAGDLIGTDEGSHEDIETSVAQDLTAMEKADLEVYKVNHHGSYTSSNAYFLNATTPEVAVISVGATNSYGHPHQEPMQRLQARDVFVYQTTSGNGHVLPPADQKVVGGHVIIETTGQNTYTVDGDTWEMDEQGETPVGDLVPTFALLGNYPNPFNPTTVVSFRSEYGGQGLFEVFDLTGRRQLKQSINASAGIHQVPWNGRSDREQTLPAGVYLYRVTLPEGRATGRMVMAK